MGTTWVERLFGEQQATEVAPAIDPHILNAGAEEIPTYMGLPLPADLIEQLKIAFPFKLSQIPSGNIGDIMVAYGNGRLVEDPNGTDLIDKLSLDPSEMAEHAVGYVHNFEPTSITTTIVNASERILDAVPEYLSGFSFVERYLSEIGQNAIGVA